MGSEKIPICYIIDRKKCSSCGLCADVCPVDAISQFRYEINQDICIGCGQCAKDCPCRAIVICKKS